MSQVLRSEDRQTKSPLPTPWASRTHGNPTASWAFGSNPSQEELAEEGPLSLQDLPPPVLLEGQ